MGWIIATIIMALDAAIGASISINKQAKIQKQATELAKQISSDRELVNNLYNAYTRKDGKLANSLIGASPFGGFYSKTIKAAKKNDADVKDLSQEIERINKAETDLNNEITNQSTKHQTSGSAVIDLIAGRAQTPVEDMSYQTSKYNNNIKESK